ncbi:chronophin [Drosophila nasuta]|uniref:Chronophin n=1 Tax=Drosophila albomicans TaxID=7291 RepID=A0A6P8XYB2_DROAB|nr:chronophin [Drosophila albomicans]XP_060664270.1 chronophin [Drosophila nasuta]
MANNSSSSSVASRPRHILQLSTEEKRRFVDSFDRVFTDIDGVIFTLQHNVPHAPDGFAALQKAGKPITYVTNNSARAVESTVRSFAQVGMEVQKEQIWHPAQSIVHYLRSINFDGLIYIIASPKFKQVLHDAGFQMIDGPNHLIEDTYSDLAKHIFDKSPVRAVVIDVDFNLTSTKLLRAHLYLRHPDCLLLTGATDRLLPVAKDINIIGPGPFASILVEASGKEPTMLGKPGRPLGDMLIEHHKVSDPKRVLMIGDMLAQDVKFGRMCGFQTLLVLTGGCTLEQLEAETSPDLVPDYYADSAADLAKLFETLVPKAHV